MDAFIIYILVSIFTPGPNNLFSSASSSKVGIVKTLPFMAGVFVGTFIVFYITGIFNVFLAEQVPVITRYIGILGGLFILYLAYGMFKTRHEEGKMMIQNDRYFYMAVVLTLINPKAIIFGLTVAAFYLGLSFPSDGMFLLSFINAFLCFVSVLVWGYFGKALKQVMKNHRTVFNIIMALLLAYSGVIIIVETI
ncbi:LysE family translocator [Candidatus Xianfuyuplasma coldseepsis]|uniref:LysE family translocator n=1 Tax=Candidatus Xianfuyuplasma coldseepsis TaxID=2782163 RepID=A0A7L7KPZ0_9MOLU|nr:LysE family translocator [Xianfuyuplasma coldseepsis]QMS84861.1 LysE family translocator [Xianfuyuplasma coldseepsis]